MRSPKRKSGYRRVTPPKVTPPSALRAEQRRLLAAQNEILRKQQELEQLIKGRSIPLVKGKKRQPNLGEVIRIQVSTAAQQSHHPQTLRPTFNETPWLHRSAHKGTRKSARNLARIQFCVLCFIFLFLLFLIWRAIP